MNFAKLKSALISTRAYIKREKAFEALHKLNEAITMLEPLKDEYPDIEAMQDGLLVLSKAYWRRKLRKDDALNI
jgi:hypothetical protein